MARYMLHSELDDLPAVNATSELRSSLETILDNYPHRPDYPRGELKGFVSGPTSIAFLFFKLSQADPHYIIREKTARDWCRLYLEHVIPDGPETVTVRRCVIASICTQLNY